MKTIPNSPRKVAELIMAWTDAGIDPITLAMRLTSIDQTIWRKAMTIVREELIPAAVAREVDEDFARRGRYSTAEELRARAAASEAQRKHLSVVGLERLKDAAVDTLMAVFADNPDAAGAEIERAFRERLARRAVQ